MSPTFTIDGDPATIDARAGDLQARSVVFGTVSTNLSAITTGGWTGRAADRFRDRFDVEPQRWQYAADGFREAATALVAYAAALRTAQQQAEQAERDYERGDAETAQARAGYDRDVQSAYRAKERWEAENGPGTYTLTIHPFVDSGEPIRAAALSDLESTRATLEAAEHECARLVRAACAHAPEKRNWFETGLAFIGGVLYGAGEAVFQIADLLNHLQFGPLYDLYDLATGNLTPEELAAKKSLQVEQVQLMWNALTTDPLGFGKQLGKSVLDWDTWADDPARALGHLVPDIALAVLTGGSATAATRGGRAAQRALIVLKDLTGYDLLELGVRGMARLSDDVIARLDDLANGRLVDSLIDRQGTRYLRPTESDTALLKAALDGKVDDIGAWLDRVNPRFPDGADWTNNCGPCSRAFADSFQGVEVRVAPGDTLRGELSEMYSWAGVTPMSLRAGDAEKVAEFTTGAWDKVAAGAKDLPDGSTLIVGVDWEKGGGHWFNAVVQDGELKWVDAQTGTTHGWPPTYSSDIVGIDVIHRPTGADPWKGMDLK